MNLICPQRTSSFMFVIKELASSKYPVYLALNSLTGQQLVLKSFPIEDIFYKKEKEILSSLQHPHIVQLCEAFDNIEIYGYDEGSYLGLEYAPHGDLLEIISRYQNLPEILARTLFHQLIDAIAYMHEQSIAHLDLKLENLLIDQNFDLRVTDFDLSQRLDSKIAKSRGTPGYRAPEIVKGLCKNLRAADIYSAGIILFILVSGIPPYDEFNRGFRVEYDAFYRALRTDEKIFWEVHSKHRGDPGFFSSEFRELFTLMVEENPAKRATVEAIKESKWYRGPVWDKYRFREEMKMYLGQ